MKSTLENSIIDDPNVQIKYEDQEDNIADGLRVRDSDDEEENRRSKKNFNNNKNKKKKFMEIEDEDEENPEEEEMDLEAEQDAKKSSKKWKKYIDDEQSQESGGGYDSQEFYQQNNSYDNYNNGYENNNNQQNQQQQKDAQGKLLRHKSKFMKKRRGEDDDYRMGNSIDTTKINQKKKKFMKERKGNPNRNEREEQSQSEEEEERKPYKQRQQEKQSQQSKFFLHPFLIQHHISQVVEDKKESKDSDSKEEKKDNDLPSALSSLFQNDKDNPLAGLFGANNPQSNFLLNLLSQQLKFSTNNIWGKNEEEKPKKKSRELQALLADKEKEENEKKSRRRNDTKNYAESDLEDLPEILEEQPRVIKIPKYKLEQMRKEREEIQKVTETISAFVKNKTDTKVNNNTTTTPTNSNSTTNNNTNTNTTTNTTNPTSFLAKNKEDTVREHEEQKMRLAEILGKYTKPNYKAQNNSGNTNNNNNNNNMSSTNNNNQYNSNYNNNSNNNYEQKLSVQPNKYNYHNSQQENYHQQQRQDNLIQIQDELQEQTNQKVNQQYQQNYHRQTNENIEQQLDQLNILPDPNNDLQKLSNLPKEGHFKYDDIPRGITSSRVIRGDIFVEVTWENRKDGSGAESTVMSTAELRHYDPKFLLDFYEAKIIQTHKDKVAQKAKERLGDKNGGREIQSKDKRISDSNDQNQNHKKANEKNKNQVNLDDSLNGGDCIEDPYKKFMQETSNNYETKEIAQKPQSQASNSYNSQSKTISLIDENMFQSDSKLQKKYGKQKVFINILDDSSDENTRFNI